MDQAAAERKVAEAVHFEIRNLATLSPEDKIWFGHNAGYAKIGFPRDLITRLEIPTGDDMKLWNHAVSLQSQLSASEERVRDSFNEGILAAANRLGELMLHSPKHDRELLINAVLELRREQ